MSACFIGLVPSLPLHNDYDKGGGGGGGGGGGAYYTFAHNATIWVSLI